MKKRAATIGWICNILLFPSRSGTFWRTGATDPHDRPQGPLLLSNLMGLSGAQKVLNVAFPRGGRSNLPLLNLEDLQAYWSGSAKTPKDLSALWRNVATSSVGGASTVLVLSAKSGWREVFGEPALNLNDIIATKRMDHTGQGRINILASDKLMASQTCHIPAVALSELFRRTQGQHAMK
jgi:hypothetical protein